MKHTYEVPIVYKGQINYIIEAESDIEAETIARAKFDNGDRGSVPVIEYEKIDRIGDIDKID